MGASKSGEAQGAVESNAEVARNASSSAGGWIAAAVSAVALVFSAFSLYESTFKQADLRLFVSPVIEYSHPGRGPFEVFQVPITIANRGARAATVLAVDLDVENPATGERKRFYGASIGKWRDANQGTTPLFTPIAVAGNAAFSGEILFYTRRGEELNRVTSQEGGTYRLRISARTTASSPLAIVGQDEENGLIWTSVEMEMVELDYRAFNNGGTLALYDTAFKATAATPPKTGDGN